MNRTALSLVVALLLLPSGVTGQDAPATGEELSLDTAVRLAIENNLSLQVAQLQIEKAEEDLGVARTRRLPSFETQVSASQLLTPVGIHVPSRRIRRVPGNRPNPVS